jgi:hemerythrin-like domain-containing protein
MEDDILTENEKSSLLEYTLAYTDYVIKHCHKCNQEERKKRDCSLLRGFSRPACNKMKKAINNRKQNKYVKSLLIDEWHDKLEELRESVNGGKQNGN